MFDLISRAGGSPNSSASHTELSQAVPAKRSAPVALHSAKAETTSFFRRLFGPKVQRPEEAIRNLVDVRKVTDEDEIEGTWREVWGFLMPDTSQNHFERQRMGALTRAFSAFDASYKKLPDDAFYQAFHLISSLSGRSHTLLIRQIVANALATDTDWAKEIVIQYSCRADEPFALSHVTLDDICCALLEAVRPMWQQPATRAVAALSLAYIANAGYLNAKHVQRWSSILDIMKSISPTEMGDAMPFMETAARILDRYAKVDRHPCCIARMQLAWPGWQPDCSETAPDVFRNHQAQIRLAEARMSEEWEKTLRPIVIEPYSAPTPSYEWGGCGPGC